MAQTMAQKFQELKEIEKRLKQGGGIAEIEKQHSKGKLTARERVEKLLDPGSFQELDLWCSSLETGFPIDAEEHPGDGVIVGYGEVNSRTVFVWSQDATVLRGTIATVHTRKIVMVMEKALQARVPIVGIIDSEGLRAEDSIQYSRFFSPEAMCYFQVMSSGIIPQIALVMGPCTGEMALSASLANFVFLVRGTSYMHVATSPAGITSEELGEAWMHAKTTGCYDVFAEDDEDCLQKCRELLSFLPSNSKEILPLLDTMDDPNRREEELLDLVPVDSSKPYSMYKLISLIVDNEQFLEIRRYWARNLIVGFTRLGGRTVGILANNPQDKGGCMNLDAADKLARHVRFCDAFNIPLLWIADTPAFLPAVDEETRGLIRHGCKVIFANSEATVPQITIAIRKLYGGGGLAMPGMMLGGDMLVSWPLLERGLMGPEGAVSIIYRKELSSIKDDTARAEQERKRVKEMADRLDLLQRESSQEFLDPRDTRPFLIKAFKALANKQQELPQRRHENIRL
ncbi:MAG: acyl-CoA carboxylase subunit beta [Chloroflexota bacterium]|nr:acyl-CoA carboxylase subunit beta [Chloroflexota bacterium]